MSKHHLAIAFAGIALSFVRVALSDDPPKADQQPDPCVTDLTLEKLDNPPERKTRFVRAEEPLKIPLNVKLIDQKFAAHIGIEVPKFGSNPFGPGRGRSQAGRVLDIFRGTEDYQQMLALQLIQGHFLLAPNTGAGDERFQSERLAQAMERMLAQIPTERAPTKADREFFSSTEIDKYVSTIVGGFRSERTFMLLGSTAEQAELRAQTLLTILDQGFSRPIQLRLFKLREAQCQQAAEQKRKIAEAETALKMIDQELEKYADFTPDTLAGVRVQQFQADAELAGLRAKIEAYEKLLAKANRAGGQFQQLSDAKTAAEVDLVSCEARRATIAGIIGKIKLRGEFMEKQTIAVATKDKAVATIEAIVKRIRAIDEDITAFGPVRLIDDKVTISAVEWTRFPESP